MITAIKSRLGLMMLLQYFIWGSGDVTLGPWLAALPFAGGGLGWVPGKTALGAIVSPFFVGLIADRAFATQRLLGVLHAFGAAILLLASWQSSFVPLYAAVLCYSLCYMPPLALTTH